MADGYQTDLAATGVSNFTKELGEGARKAIAGIWGMALPGLAPITVPVAYALFGPNYLTGKEVAKSAAPISSLFDSVVARFRDDLLDVVMVLDADELTTDESIHRNETAFEAFWNLTIGRKEQITYMYCLCVFCDRVRCEKMRPMIVSKCKKHKRKGILGQTHLFLNSVVIDVQQKKFYGAGNRLNVIERSLSKILGNSF